MNVAGNLQSPAAWRYENVLPHDLLFTDAFGARGDDVLFADLIKKGVLVSIVSAAKPLMTVASTGSVMCQK